MRDNFSCILNRRTFTVWSFVEERAVTGIGKVCHAYLHNTTLCLILIGQVVYGESVMIGDPFEDRGTIYADHFGMAKFSSRGDSEYQKVSYAIEMLLEGNQEEKSAPASPSMFAAAMSTFDGLIKSFSVIVGLSKGHGPSIPQ